MNERFRELAQLAVADAAKYCQRPFDLTREENETFALSLAELIVKECIDKILDSSVEYTTRPRVAIEIKEHFGVEE
jgi:hypothetical protein